MIYDYKILEGNIKVALFMGYEIDGDWVLIPDDEFQGKMHTTTLKYNTDWNKQIPVWNKLFELVMDNLVGKDKPINFMQIYLTYEIQLNHAIRLNKPDDGQIALVEAIQWYQKQTEPKMKL